MAKGTLGPSSRTALWNISCYLGLWFPFPFSGSLQASLFQPPVSTLPGLLRSVFFLPWLPPALWFRFLCAAASVMVTLSEAASAHSAASEAPCTARLGCHHHQCRSTACFTASVVTFSIHRGKQARNDQWEKLFPGFPVTSWQHRTMSQADWMSPAGLPYEPYSLLILPEEGCQHQS